MGERLAQLGEAMDRRDLLEVALLAIAIFVLLRLLGRARGTGVVRGLGLLAAGIFLVTQLIIVSLDLHELRKVLDYLLTTVVVGLIVIFQPELRRGLMVLGRVRGLRLFAANGDSLAECLADAAAALARDHVGALIAIQRELSLEAYAETGEPLDARVSPLLLRTLFIPQGPLHDGAAVIRGDRIVAAGCQLPLAQPNPELAAGWNATPGGLGPERRNRCGARGRERRDRPRIIVGRRQAGTDATRAIGGAARIVARPRGVNG